MEVELTGFADRLGVEMEGKETKMTPQCLLVQLRGCLGHSRRSVRLGRRFWVRTCACGNEEFCIKLEIVTRRPRGGATYAAELCMDLSLQGGGEVGAGRSLESGSLYTAALYNRNKMSQDVI